MKKIISILIAILVFCPNIAIGLQVNNTTLRPPMSCNATLKPPHISHGILAKNLSSLRELYPEARTIIDRLEIFLKFSRLTRVEAFNSISFNGGPSIPISRDIIYRKRRFNPNEQERFKHALTKLGVLDINNDNYTAMYKLVRTRLEKLLGYHRAGSKVFYVDEVSEQAGLPDKTIWDILANKQNIKPEYLIRVDMALVQLEMLEPALYPIQGTETKPRIIDTSARSANKGLGIIVYGMFELRRASQGL